MAVDRRRSIATTIPGVRVHYVSALAARALWEWQPPRMSLAAATIDAAGIARDDLAALAVVAKAVQDGLTTPDALLAELDLRGRAAKGAWIRRILSDVAEGACSVLEYGFRDRVLRPHGLPAGVLQEKDRIPGPVDLDVELYTVRRLNAHEVILH